MNRDLLSKQEKYISCSIDERECVGGGVKIELIALKIYSMEE